MAPSTTTKKTHQTTTAPALDRKALLYMFLLALQFGMQPLLVRRYTSRGVTKSTVVLMQELIKFAMALFMLNSTGTLRAATKGWTVSLWFAVAFTPAALYSVQNMAALTAYQNLDAVTYNVLNQTKTLSAALCCYLVMGRRQSRVQVLALLLLLLSALIVEGIVPVNTLLPKVLGGTGSPSLLEEDGSDGDAASSTSPIKWGAKHFTHGVVPILLASFISGLAGALSQKNLQAAGGGRNAYLFSMELCAGSVLLLCSSMLLSEDGQRIREEGFWAGWTPYTFIPIVTNAAGGLIVGLVTKYAGSVRKGFALIFGILLSGVIQSAFEPEQTISAKHIVAGALAAWSLYLHSLYPAVAPASKEKKEK